MNRMLRPAAMISGCDGLISSSPPRFRMMAAVAMIVCGHSA